ERIIRLIPLQVSVGRHDRAVVTAVQLMEVAAVPALREPHLEADRVRLPVLSRPLVDGAADCAVRRRALVVAYLDGRQETRSGQSETRERIDVASRRGRRLRERGAERDAECADRPGDGGPDTGTNACGHRLPLQSIAMWRSADSNP